MHFYHVEKEQQDKSYMIWVRFLLKEILSNWQWALSTNVARETWEQKTLAGWRMAQSTYATKSGVRTVLKQSYGSLRWKERYFAPEMSRTKWPWWTIAPEYLNPSIWSFSSGNYGTVLWWWIVLSVSCGKVQFHVRWGLLNLYWPRVLRATYVYRRACWVPGWERTPGSWEPVGFSDRASKNATARAMLYARQVGGSLAFCAVSFEGYYYAVRLGSFCLYHLRRASYILYILYRLIISKQCFFSFSF